MPRLRLIVCGASGRVGSRVAALARQDPRFEPAACLAHERPAPDGWPVLRPQDLPRAAAGADVLVDFTLPEPSLAHAKAAAEALRPIVIGTTGFTEAQAEEIRKLSEKTAVFLSPNMSPAMNVMFHLAESAWELLRGYDAAIVEAHHKAKRDAPSGSALRLAKAVPGASTVSVRAGGIVGDHTLIFAGPNERLELVHRAQSRDVFAQGALEAAAWLAGKTPGLYDFTDLLGLRGAA